jgi:ribosomal protein S18 acetylase RimI-like enzyme
MEHLTIKNVIPADLDLLQQISKQTFTETFARNNSTDSINKYLSTALSAEKLNTELNEKDSTFYFAMLQDQIIGYLKLNFGNAQTDVKESNGVEIERIYVLAEYHGLKVGQFLYEKAMEAAAQKGADYVWLGVWEKNPRAIRFYEKNGFTQFNQHSFYLGDEEQTDIMKKKTL